MGKFFLVFITLIFSHICFSQLTINMEKDGGVYTIPCAVNGLNLKFIFDTGASDVSISLTEANFMLKNGYLDYDDIVGKQNYRDATGKISVGTIINIKEIYFSGLTLYNVKASIVNELSAPLLLGQSAMAKLGKFIFDPINAKLTIINYENKIENNKKQALAEVIKNQNDIQSDSKKAYTEKFGSVMAEKVQALAQVRKTATKAESGLEYVIVKGNGEKPADKTTVYVNYSGYLEDGSLFDSSDEQVNKNYGKWDSNRAAQNGYQPFPFEIGNKGGLIPRFLEGLGYLSFGDKATFFIPAKLGYGKRGAGAVIPPNANIIFEVEILKSIPGK